MRHTHTLTFTTMALLVAAMAPQAQSAQGIRVVRDDDGTADAGRGQVTSHRSVVRKTLILDVDPANVTRAWVLYCMKIKPYDVATRRLYDKPAEGVEWANLVVSVNGAEVLHGSLIEHGTQGWHEVTIDSALLKRGANHVALTLDRGGSYFYLGIDRSAPKGRSASSRDGGKTFRENWLSFGTKEPDPGEYMIRLRIEAPEAEPVGFTERNGKHYGWIEVEDLFSATRPHSSGFKAITWTKGVNQPSAGKVAWGAEGRFAIPMEIPADRHWRVWTRCWMDGFRGGTFKLSCDGRPVFDSAGKHQFTSDAGLRFDWLDVGTVHLGEGHHSLGIQTFGQCGHMFDVFVLTTDMAYRPDETAPLPRMTTVSPLVKPEGLSELKPGLFMTENPVPWAKPLAGGTLHALWVCADINERDIIELQRRLDMTADVISSPIAYYGKSIFGSDLNLSQGDLLYDVLAKGKPRDVAVLVRTKLDQIPQHAMETLLARVRDGMGLVVVRSRREGEETTALSEVLSDTQKLTFPAFASPCELRHLRYARWRQLGKGRVVVLPHTLYGTMHRVAVDSQEIRYPYWEYQFAQWAKLLTFASGRDGPHFPSLAAPERVSLGDEALLKVETSQEAGGQVTGFWWSPLSAQGRPLTLSDTGTLTLPSARTDGLHRVCLILKNSDGRVLDFASAHYRVEAPVRIVDINGTCGADLQASLSTSNRGEAVTRRVHADVIGSRGRLLANEDAQVRIAPGQASAELRLPLVPSWERLIELRIDLKDAQGATCQHMRRRLTRPQPAALDDYIPYAGVWENLEVPCYCRSAYMRIFDRVGIKAVQSATVFWHSLDQGFATAQPYTLTSIGNPTVTDDGIRRPCLHDDAMWEKEEKRIRERTRSKVQFSPLALGLGDEMQMGSSECCFSPHTLAAFREHLREEYGDLRQLNEAWETQLPNWDAVVPWRLSQAKDRPRNIAPWLEFRVFMMHTFVDTMAKAQRWVKEEAPNTLAGAVNPWAETWTTCVALSKLFPILEYGQIYPRFHDRARSWFRDPRLIGLWSGYSRPREQIEREAWLLPAYGGTLMCWYGIGRQLGYRTLTNTLGLGERAKWIAACNRELCSGIGKLLIEAEPVPEEVAILHSYRSRFAFTALRTAEDSSRRLVGWDQQFNEFEEGFASLLRRLRIPYRLIDEDQIEAGQLSRFRLLVAPQAVSLSDAALRRISEFARTGPVIIDEGFGRYDHRGRRREDADATLLGDQVELWQGGPVRVTNDSLARMRRILTAAGLPDRESSIRGNASLVVHRKLEDLDILIVFGKGDIQLKLPGPRHAYNARAHTYLGHRADPAAKAEHGPAVFVLSDEKMPKLTLRVPERARRGQPLTFGLSLSEPVSSVAHVELIGPDDELRPWYSRNVLLAAGRCSGRFRFALNDPLGKWRVRARDVIRGSTAEARFAVVP